MNEGSMSGDKRCLAAAITLFFVSPLVAEYLLGDFSIAWLPLLLLMAPMYGGGALLIREVTRRSGRGWPTMLLLSAAYALIEEGFATQSLFNPNFLAFHFLRYAWIPALGIGAWWTMLALNVHVFWSMGASIALVEGLFPSRARTPWLGRLGFGVATALFAAGVASNTAVSLRQYHFHASVMQFAVTALLCVVSIAAAFLLPKPAPREQPGWAPSPWIAGAVAFVLGAAFLFTPPQLNWGAFAWIVAIDLFFLVALGVVSRRRAWTPLHTLSLAAGAAVFYGVHAFTGKPVIPSPEWVTRSGNAIFLGLAIGLIVIAARRTRSWMAAEPKPVAAS
jgi:hypothetical protein